MEWYKDKNRRTGILVTIGAHLLLILLLSFLVLEPPFPPPPQLGVEVNLGNSNQGMTDIQPDNPMEQSSKTNPSSNKIENIATQDSEESVKLKKTDKKTEEQKPVDEEPVINQDFTFKKTNKKDGGNEGITGKPGDQGMENGSANANNYVGDGGSGGVSYSLSGRNVKSLTRPEKVPNMEGRVVIKIWVNKMGKVTNAAQEVPKSTTTNSVLVQKAINSAYSSIFDTNPNAPEVQTGYITYIFAL